MLKMATAKKQVVGNMVATQTCLRSCALQVNRGLQHVAWPTCNTSLMLSTVLIKQVPECLKLEQSCRKLEVLTHLAPPESTAW